MPSARPSSFKGASGILRDVDATIVGLRFTDQNPLAGKGTPKPGQKKSDFHTLFAVLDVLVDGAQAASPQPIFVGDADAFGITEDGMGLTGDGQLSKSSGWFIFLDSIVNPANGEGFDENNFPDDDPTVADYSALVGARVRFNWKANEKATKKYGQKVSKTDPKKKYDREDLIVTAYYGQVDVDQLLQQTEASATASQGAGKRTTANTPRPAAPAVSQGPRGGKGKTQAVNIGKVAADNIILALNAAKDKTMSKSKVSVKLLTQLGTESPELRQQVRDWADSNENLASIENVTFDAATGMLKLDLED